MARNTLARTVAFACAAAALLALCLPAASRADGDGIQLVPNTAVLLSNTGGGSGGNGGNGSSASSATNIFAPASYVDYHELGGEPTTVVDRYPFSTGKTYRDLVYVSNPLGLAFPGFSEFYKSSDGGTTFRVPSHNPFFTEPNGPEASGGGDSHQAVGQRTDSVFFVDLSGRCVTVNIPLGP